MTSETKSSEEKMAMAEDEYCQKKRDLLDKYDLKLVSISNHLVGQAVSDPIDERHKSSLPEHVWGDGSGDRHRVPPDPETTRPFVADSSESASLDL